MIKIAFFDIDGTLVDFKTHEISRKSVESLHRLRQNGVKLFIASGRHLLLMDNLDNFPFDGYVCMNGALIFKDGKVISKRPMDVGDSRRVIGIAESRRIPCVVFCEDRVVINCYNDATEKTFDMIRLPLPEPVPIGGLDPDKICQMTIFVSEEEEAELLAPVLEHTDSTRWHPLFTDLVPAGLSKAEGIARVLEEYGFSREETIAFGDGGNDVEMLGFAGIGVAMGNASDEVKAHADYVTASVDEDGVTRALEHFGLI